MVGAEESLEIKRMEAGTEAMEAAAKRRAPNAKHAIGIHSTQFCQNVSSKPGALLLG
jgi:hypothetical protein